MFNDKKYQSEKGVHDDDEPLELFDGEDFDDDPDYDVGGFVKRDDERL